MSVLRWLTVAALGAALSGCGSSNDGYPVYAGPVANLQVVHAVADAPPVTILIDGQPAVLALDYAEGTGEQVFPAGSHTVEVQALTAPSPVTIYGPTSVTLGQNMDYVIVVGGVTGSVTGQIYPHALATVPSGSAKVQFVHAAPAAPTVDVYVTAPGAVLSAGTPVGSVAYPDAIGPTQLASGSVEIRLTPHGNPATVLYDSGTTTLPDGSDLVVSIVPNVEAGTAPVELSVVDAQGGNERLADAASPAPTRFVHAAPGTATLALVANGAVSPPFIPSEAYAGASAYADLASGAYTLTIAPAANPSGTLASTTGTLLPGRSHTVYAFGTPTALNVSADRDAPRRYATQARLKVVNGAPSAPNVDVYLVPTGTAITAATPAAPSLPFSADTGSVTYAPGSYDLVVTAAGSKTPLLGPVTVSLAAKGLYTAVVRDAPGGGAPLGLIRLDDL